MTDIQSILESKRPAVEVAWILLDPDLQIKREGLEQDLEAAQLYDARHNEPDRAPAVEKAIDEIEATIAESRVAFTFQAIGRANYGKLLDEWKPREGNPTDKDVGFNTDEFPPRLLALSAVDPAMTLLQAQEVWDSWSDAETTKLVLTAIKANRESVDIPFTRTGSRMEASNTDSVSPTPTTMESHTKTDS
jgi:hypothetical protein